MTEVKELTCGVCKDFFRNPYLLPCGHSFFGGHAFFGLPRPPSGPASTVTFRDLHDHCATCPHCDRQLCGLCFGEHVDELQGRLKRKFQVLREAVSPLKQAREALISRRASGSRGGELSKGIDAATIALKSACESAFLRANTRLSSIGLRTKDRLLPALDKGHLLELAAKLLRTVNNPMQHKGVRGLCKLRSLQSLGAKLESMNLLVDEGSMESEPDSATTTCGNPPKAGEFHASQSGVNSSSFKSLAENKNKQNISMKAQFSVPKFDTPTQTTSTQTRLTRWQQRKQQQRNDQQLKSTKRSKSTMATASTPRRRQCANQGTPSGRATSAKTTTQQQQIGLEVGRSASTPRRALTLILTGLKATVSRNDLVTHFGRFGEVLSVQMHRNLSTNMRTGRGNIVLWPTTSPDRILTMEHTVHGVPINVSSGTHPTVWVLDQYGPLQTDAASQLRTGAE
ncbi:NHL repeat [Sparganum proliferum]